MRAVEIFISNGSDRDQYRDTAMDVMERLRQLLQFELNYNVTINNWDYRRASPTVVPAGGVAAPSLGIVDRSNAVVAIFGRRCPRITRDEIDRAFARRVLGEPIEVFIFVNPDLRSNAHDAFFAELRDSHGVEPVWAPYADRLSFQAIVFTTLTRFLLEHLEISNPALIGGSI